MKMKEWLPVWLTEYIRPTTKHRTYLRYRSLIEQHLLPHLGERDLADVTPLVLQQMVTGLLQDGNHLTGDGLAPNTVNALITLAQSSLRAAYALGYLPAYTADRVKRPPVAEKTVECFTSIEQKIIEKAVRADRRPKMFGVLLCLYTGLRLGEMLALTWEDVDFEKCELTVSKSCYDGKKDGVACRLTDSPKTPNSRRTIPFPRQLLPFLRAQKKAIHSRYVVGEDGIGSIRSYQSSFSSLLRRVGVPHRGFHALRHTFATRALENGMDVRSLADILGHKNAAVTLNRYVHSLMPHKHEMMDQLGELL